MASYGETTLPATRRTRKSIGSHSDLHQTMDKENATVDVASSMSTSRKKSRSKSIGPGGLDALKQGNGNRRASLAIPSKPPRSILKPTIATLPEIPPLKRKPSQDVSRTASPSIDELSGSKIALRTEEEQQAAAREREERDRRDARRKSLANRRVSFAAEATLHTFHEVEFMQDSTTSTEASRRASAKPSASNVGQDRESTPQDHQLQAPESPDNQRELHQRKRRRSSGAQSTGLDYDDDTLTSTIYSSDSEPADAVEEIGDEEDEEEGPSSDSDDDDGTMMTMETEEVTGVSLASERSVATVDESSTLDEALRLAARRAGTQRLDEDDSDDGEEIIPSFGWVKKDGQQNTSQPPAQQQRSFQSPQENDEGQDEDGTAMEMEMDTEMDMDMDMETTRAVGRILKPLDHTEANQDEDMSMDVTRAIGGILANSKGVENEEPSGEATMEFTTAIGGIHRTPDEESILSDGNEDMSMEFTNVLGGVLNKQKARDATLTRRRTMTRPSEVEDDSVMEMTVAVGRIIPQAEPAGDDEGEADMTMGMEMTTAIGGIINAGGAAGSRALGKKILEEEVNIPDSPGEELAKSPLTSPLKKLAAEAFIDLDSSPMVQSPGLSAFRGNGLRRSTGPNNVLESSPVRISTSRTPSPAKPSTPQTRTPLPERARSASPTKSPGRLSQKSSPVRPRPRSSSRTPSPVKTKGKQSVFQTDPQSGSRTPTVVLTPQSRRLSGLGADRQGLGSPRVAALIERRGSIGDAATEFVSGKRGVTFGNSQEIFQEFDQDRQDEEGTQSRRADGASAEPHEDKDATVNLREMIDSLSPKRKPMRGRKSLHVGSARGLLGKRPAELDDEDAEENDGVKRLKGHQSSPVKNVRLPHHTSMTETNNRTTRSTRRSLDQTASRAAAPLSSPLKNATPRAQNRSKDGRDRQTIHNVNFQQSPQNDDSGMEGYADEDRIHLQDFLNMTSIRFMELNTTKRRHTTAPGTLVDGSMPDGQDNLSLERCVVAGACTVPMLELYQHSCRELKKYIAEGRNMVREIETETFEDNPPLFREYMSATPEVKALMDNQFKNVKTHARLLSKAMWYEWRMKLQDGLKEGLVKISEGMENDYRILEEQQSLLESVTPELVKRYETLMEHSRNLEEAARELADCDPEELQASRDELSSLDDDIAKKRKLIAELRADLEASEADVTELTAQKEACLVDITEAEKIREECRGWTSTEVNTLKARVDAIEKEHGWAVTGLSGTALSLTYKREIELVLDIAAFQPQQPNSQIDLWYIADSREYGAQPKTVEKDFFVQCIRDYIRALPQSRTKVSDLLCLVRDAWDKANRVALEVERINVAFPTTVTKTSDSSIAMTSSLLLVPLETRVEVTLNLHGCSGPDGIEVGVKPEASVIYGETFNVGKIGEFLSTRIGDKVGAGGEDWSSVVTELHGRLIARGRK
ncbi:hypothetical protein B0I35DRAFT_392081 [Stachybotrys elegans]|uniref:Spc7 kinetochore protein domain-containing protein n=1 Tax=Stachybotrys elegans TaxID=80388 RepID=A0A8K0SUA6_9HYPO|nr:hypothetical protein B0I35DRAFT_392081 [Stachybotrys elegans]